VAGRNSGDEARARAAVRSRGRQGTGRGASRQAGSDAGRARRAAREGPDGEGRRCVTPSRGSPRRRGAGAGARERVAGWPRRGRAQARGPGAGRTSGLLSVQLRQKAGVHLVAVLVLGKLCVRVLPMQRRNGAAGRRGQCTGRRSVIRLGRGATGRSSGRTCMVGQRGCAARGAVSRGAAWLAEAQDGAFAPLGRQRVGTGAGLARPHVVEERQLALQSNAALTAP